MTGRVLAILKQYAAWEKIEDIHLLYRTLIDFGFDPDEMTYEELAQTAYNLVPFKLFGKTSGYVWHMFDVGGLTQENNKFVR